jgi:hypothetical protein
MNSCCFPNHVLYPSSYWTPVYEVGMYGRLMFTYRLLPHVQFTSNDVTAVVSYPCYGPTGPQKTAVEYERLYNSGTRFVLFEKGGRGVLSGTYVLACVAPRTCELINLSTGYRWTEAVNVEDVNAVTDAEMALLVGHGYDYARCG